MARDDIVGLVVGVGILAAATYAIYKGYLGQAVDALLNLKLPDIGGGGGGTDTGGGSTGGDTGGGTDTGDGGSTTGGAVKSFVCAGDWGTGRHAEPSVSITKQALTGKPGLFVGLGDYSYSSAKAFDPVYTQIKAAKIPSIWTHGNHDGNDYLTYFGQKSWTFAYEAGDVVFVCLDGNSSGASNATVLDNALKTSKAKWRIVFIHQPMHSPSSSHGDDACKCAVAIKPLLMKYKVQLVLQGHNHIYGHTPPQAGQTTFAVVGTGGESA